MNQRISLTAQAHSIILKHLGSGECAIDATVGNGHDTLFLAQQVGSTGTVFGFDIQQQAIESTQTRVNDNNCSNITQLFQTSHANIAQSIPLNFHGKIKAIMFNLGYLPGSDKSIITQTESTLNALAHAINLLAKPGLLTIAAYPGHSGGKSETDAIKQWLEQLPSDQYSTQTIYSSEKETAPRLYIIKKLLR